MRFKAREHQDRLKKKDHYIKLLRKYQIPEKETLSLQILSPNFRSCEYLGLTMFNNRVITF